MRIVFVGAVEFSRHCLEVLFAMKENVVAVLSPSRDAARNNSDYADLSLLAESNAVPFHGFRTVKDPSTVDLIRSLKPDVVFAFGLSQLIPAELLRVPPLGWIGSHPALLPRNRGRHPLIWTLVEGLSESGLTFLFLDEGTDSGDILWQRPFPIMPSDDASTLYRKIEDLATRGIQEFLPRLKAGTSMRTPQDHSQASYWRKRTAADGELDWRQPAERIHNMIRALTHPYPGAQSYHEGQTVRFWRSVRTSQKGSKSAAPGTVLALMEGRLLIQCGDEPLDIVNWECAIGDSLTVGTRLTPGEAAP